MPHLDDLIESLETAQLRLERVGGKLNALIARMQTTHFPDDVVVAEELKQEWIRALKEILG